MPSITITDVEESRTGLEVHDVDWAARFTTPHGPRWIIGFAPMEEPTGL